jgi:hypothetical protein
MLSSNRQQSPPTATRTPLSADNTMLQRIYSEFMEMPGLRLTRRQAQRLWGLDEQTCREVLDLLVDARFLCWQGHVCASHRRVSAHLAVANDDVRSCSDQCAEREGGRLTLRARSSSPDVPRAR